MNPDVPFGMPLGFLFAADKRADFRKQAVDHTEIECDLEPDGRTCRLQQQLFDLSPDPFGREIVQCNLPAHGTRRFLERKFETCGKLHGAKDSQRIFGKRSHVNGLEYSCGDVAPSVEGVDVLVEERIPGDGVDRKVTAPRRVSEGEGWVAGDLERSMPAAGTRFAAGKRDIDISDFVDRE